MAVRRAEVLYRSSLVSRLIDKLLSFEQSYLLRALNRGVQDFWWAQGLALYAAQRGVAVSSGLAVVFCMTAAISIGIVTWVITRALLLGILVSATVAFGATGLARQAEVVQRQQVAQQMIEVFRSSSVALRTGKSLAQTIAYIAKRVDDPLKPIFLGASLQYVLGRGQRAAVEYLQEHLHAPGAQLFSSALQIALQTGSGLEDMFERACASLEMTLRQERELYTKTAQARLSAQVVGIMPLILVLILSMISPDFRMGLNTAIGSISLAIAALLDVVGWMIMQRLIHRNYDGEWC